MQVLPRFAAWATHSLVVMDDTPAGQQQPGKGIAGKKAAAAAAAPGWLPAGRRLHPRGDSEVPLVKSDVERAMAEIQARALLVSACADAGITLISMAACRATQWKSALKGSSTLHAEGAADGAGVDDFDVDVVPHLAATQMSDLKESLAELHPSAMELAHHLKELATYMAKAVSRLHCKAWSDQRPVTSPLHAAGTPPPRCSDTRCSGWLLVARCVSRPLFADSMRPVLVQTGVQDTTLGLDDALMLLQGLEAAWKRCQFFCGVGSLQAARLEEQLATSLGGSRDRRLSDGKSRCRGVEGRATCARPPAAALHCPRSRVFCSTLQRGARFAFPSSSLHLKQRACSFRCLVAAEAGAAVESGIEALQGAIIAGAKASPGNVRWVCAASAMCCNGADTSALHFEPLALVLAFCLHQNTPFACSPTLTPTHLLQTYAPARLFLFCAVRR